MPSLATALIASATFAFVRAQGVLVSAKGSLGESTSMAVVLSDPTDATYISQDEIVANIVNACGRTILKGGISQSGETEKVIAAGTFTRVQRGSDLTVTVAQRTQEGSGPFVCDLDEASNVLGVDGQTNLTVQQDSSQFGTGNLTLTVTMPTNMTCIGGSTGNFCTIRCKNAQNFGGCLAVQQTDVTPATNDPATIQSAEKKNDIAAQVKQNEADLTTANKGLTSAKSADDVGIKIAQALLEGHSITAAAITASATATPSVTTGTTKSKTRTAARATGTGTQSRKGRKGSSRTGTSRTGASRGGTLSGTTGSTRSGSTTGSTLTGSTGSSTKNAQSLAKDVAVESVDDATAESTTESTDDGDDTNTENTESSDDDSSSSSSSSSSTLAKRRRVFGTSASKQSGRRALKAVAEREIMGAEALF